MKNAVAKRKKVSQHLLHFAENDNFRPVLHLLLSESPASSSSSSINLNSRTSSGDYLITLLAYFICEIGGGDGGSKYKYERVLALKCLKLVLERDFSAVNKVGGDGSSALHCALAAASYEDEGEATIEIDNEEESDDDDPDDDSIYSDGDEEDSNIDQSFLADIERMASMDSQMDSYCAEFDSLTIEEISFAAIHLLLHHGADPNVPLANVNGIQMSSDGYQGEDEDEVELTFSRESVVQQWTPLLFAMQWIIIACIKILRGKAEDGNDGNPEQVLALPYAVLRLLLDFDADRTYMMAGDDACSDWNLAQVVTSASHLLSKILVEQSHLSNLADKIKLNSSSILAIAEKVEASEIQPLKISVYYIMLSIATAGDIVPCDIQAFAAALLMNDSLGCSEIIQRNSKADLQQWSHTLFEGVVPTLQAVWGNSALSEKSLFDVACSCFSIECLSAIMAKGVILTEKQIRSAIVSIFEDLAGRALSESASADAELVKSQSAMVMFLLENGVEGKEGSRQRILDRLLIESCSGKLWTICSPHATQVLLLGGADPNVNSISNEIQGALKPLHLVAGNCRGHVGVEKMQCLLFDDRTSTSRRANLYAMTLSREIPINIALQKKNFLVAERLLEEMGCNWKELKWSTEDVILIGEVSIYCANVGLFKQAVNLLVSIFSNDDGADQSVLEQALGGFLVSVCDERSGFGKVRPTHALMENIKSVVCFLEKKQRELGLVHMASWARDAISGYNIIHLILRGDRGKEFREEILPCVCKLITGPSTHGTTIISQQCAAKFGGYTPLHLAASLGCEESIKTLLKYNANARALDEQQKTPSDLIPESRECLKIVLKLID